MWKSLHDVIVAVVGDISIYSVHAPFPISELDSQPATCRFQFRSYCWIWNIERESFRWMVWTMNVRSKLFTSPFSISPFETIQNRFMEKCQSAKNPKNNSFNGFSALIIYRNKPNAACAHCLCRQSGRWNALDGPLSGDDLRSLKCLASS